MMNSAPTLSDGPILRACIGLVLALALLEASRLQTEGELGATRQDYGYIRVLATVVDRWQAGFGRNLLLGSAATFNQPRVPADQDTSYSHRQSKPLTHNKQGTRQRKAKASWQLY
jgi:hypothetical protein